MAFNSSPLVIGLLAATQTALHPTPAPHDPGHGDSVGFKIVVLGGPDKDNQLTVVGSPGYGDERGGRLDCVSLNDQSTLWTYTGESQQGALGIDFVSTIDLDGDAIDEVLVLDHSAPSIQLLLLSGGSGEVLGREPLGKSLLPPFESNAWTRLTRAPHFRDSDDYLAVAGVVATFTGAESGQQTTRTLAVTAREAAKPETQAETSHDALEPTDRVDLTATALDSMALSSTDYLITAVASRNHEGALVFVAQKALPSSNDVILSALAADNLHSPRLLYELPPMTRGVSHVIAPNPREIPSNCSSGHSATVFVIGVRDNPSSERRLFISEHAMQTGTRLRFWDLNLQGIPAAVDIMFSDTERIVALGYSDSRAGSGSVYFFDLEKSRMKRTLLGPDDALNFGEALDLTVDAHGRLLAVVGSPTPPPDPGDWDEYQVGPWLAVFGTKWEVAAIELGQ